MNFVAKFMGPANNQELQFQSPVDIVALDGKSKNKGSQKEVMTSSM